MSHQRACMGGWCAIRERCTRYTAPGHAVERLCEPKQHNAFRPLKPVIRIKDAA